MKLCSPRQKSTMFKFTIKNYLLVVLLLNFIIILYVTIQASNQASRRSEEEAVTANIFKAIRTSNTSSLVVPNESTIIVRPCNEESCQDSGSDVFVLFMVISSPGHKLQRDILRSTLATYIKQPSFFFSNGRREKVNQLLFFMGLSGNNLLDEEVKAESDLHRDMVVDNFDESYLNLTLKSLRMLKFFQEDCRKAKYLVKIDDDVHLNVFNFFHFLKNVSKNESSLLIAGHKYSNGVRDKNPSSKWYTPTVTWPQDKLPDYVAGPFYFLGRRAASNIYRASLTTPFFHLEDIFVTGIVATIRLEMEIHDIPEIQVYWFPSFNMYTSSCAFQNYMAVHSADPNDLLCWSKFNLQGFKCGHTPINFYC